MQRLCLTGLFTLLMLIVAVPEARSCTCAGSRSWQAVDSSDVLFAGKLVEAKLSYFIEDAPWINVPESLIPGLRPNRVSLTFEVERWWYGSGRRYVEVLTDRSSCALPTPNLGRDMLIEAVEYRGAVFTHLCSRSVPLHTSGEVQVYASDSAYQNRWLLTRDSLRTHLGVGFEPSGFASWWYVMVAVVAAVGALIWSRRTKAA